MLLLFFCVDVGKFIYCFALINNISPNGENTSHHNLYIYRYKTPNGVYRIRVFLFMIVT